MTPVDQAALKYIAGTVGGWLRTRATGALLAQEDVLGLLRRFGYDHLRDDFANLYANALVLVAAQGKPEPLLDLLRDRAMMAAVERYWRSGDSAALERDMSRTAEALAAGDAAKQLAIDLRTEVSAFAALFQELAQRARTPGEQEVAVLLRQILNRLAPPFSDELEAVLKELDERCRAANTLLTRAHLAAALLKRRMSRMTPPVAAAMASMLPRLEQELARQRGGGFGRTDGVERAIVTARQYARDAGLQEVQLDRLLATLLRDPGDNLQSQFAAHRLSPGDVANELARVSPAF